ncbi:hypothetical protein ACXO2A_00455 [Lactobacillus delbrueckii subsp. bulgaricus]
MSLPRNGSNQLTVYLKTEAVTGQVQLTKLGYASASAKGKASQFLPLSRRQQPSLKSGCPRQAVNG